MLESLRLRLRAAIVSSKQALRTSSVMSATLLPFRRLPINGSVQSSSGSWLTYASTTTQALIDQECFHKQTRLMLLLKQRISEGRLHRIPPKDFYHLRWTIR
ncbi:unnamed protein product [Callosobruchus maculatus]|uniref:Uncharacterized protein n=1 Tax=Callosobruchus maculatus TaxID=64391 RepID=A0A653CYP0_CALMS|nr:unnamed protein product [Callosobruchus maculatus]